VGGQYRGVSYPGARVQFAAGETTTEVEVRIHDVSDDARGVRVEGLRMRFDRDGAQLLVSESVRFSNPTGRAVFVPAAERAPRTALFETRLPEGAGALSGPLGVVPEGVVRDGDVLRFFGPLLPGSHGIDYGYPLAVEGTGALLRRPLGSLRSPTELLVPSGGLAAEAPGFDEGELEQLRGRHYRVLTARDPDETLEVAFTLPPARFDPGALALLEVRIIGEVDEAALVAREEHVLSVSGESMLLGDAERPLLRLPLPEGAQDLRFATSSPGVSLGADPGGALAVLGPLPPGETQVELRYRLPRDGSSLRLRRSFGRELPLFSVFIADTGRLDLRSERLHRRRPVRDGTRTYAHLEAFQIEPEEAVELEIGALAPRTPFPRWGRAAYLSVAALLAIALLTGPLRRGGSEAGEEERDDESAAERERRALYASLRDLEDDHATGKIDDGDYASMRSDLRGRAAALIVKERTEQHDAPTPGPEADGCPGCGRSAAPGDRFCSGCGSPLAPGGEAGAPG